MAKHTLLVVDDEAAQRESLAGFLSKKGFTVLQASSGEEALEIIRRNVVDLVLSDWRMPGMDGGQLLRRSKELNPEIDVLIMTAFGSLENGIQAMKDGATDFVTKPIDLIKLEITIAKTLERKLLLSENRRLKELLGEQLPFGGILTASSAMQEALSIAARAAASKATILILGESGTGKELVARAIHIASPRAEQPFVAVNMAALPEQLMESELFGHEKGAFTGADRLRKGRFESADGGTLFIDEVGDMPAGIQVKLLRVLQNQSFERLGSSTPIQVDVRLIAATNRKLEEMVKAGSFREDIYYRLNVVRIVLPPLRERKSDIPLLANHFIQRFAERNEKKIPGASREVMDALLKYHFPGNVRELENIIEQAVVLCRDEILHSADLPYHIRTGEAGLLEDDMNLNFTDRVGRFEQNLIRQALLQSNGVQSQAARLLGITERHLRYKLQKYGMK